MKKRPLEVTIVGWLFIVAGASGFVYHIIGPEAFDLEHILVLVVRLLAIVGGASVLFGQNWARWLLICWIGYHVILSFWHSTSEIAAHIVLLLATTFALLNSRASVYFRKIA